MVPNAIYILEGSPKKRKEMKKTIEEFLILGMVHQKRSISIEDINIIKLWEQINENLKLLQLADPIIFRLYSHFQSRLDNMRPNSCW